MVNDKKYPEDFLSFEYDPNFSIRGLHFDCKRGVLLKLDFVFNINVDTVYYGRKLLQPHQIVKLYPGLHVSFKIKCFFVFLFIYFCFVVTTTIC